MKPAKPTSIEGEELPPTSDVSQEIETVEWETADLYPPLPEGTARPGDEDIVRRFLQSRMVQWRQLPYAWMQIGDEGLYEWGLLDCPTNVREAYQRSRADPEQWALYEADYDRKVDPTDWVEKLEREAGLPN